MERPQDVHVNFDKIVVKGLQATGRPSFFGWSSGVLAIVVDSLRP